MILYNNLFIFFSDFCSKPPESGVCSTMFIAWFYNSTKQECQEFIYLGCGGNQNRFKTEEECYSKCKGLMLERAKFTNHQNWPQK